MGRHVQQPIPLTPSEVSSRARAEASQWIAVAPNLIDVLAWHRRLCGVCGPSRRCGESLEILDEYGAGVYGAAVFYPDESEAGRDR